MIAIVREPWIGDPSAFFREFYPRLFAAVSAWTAASREEVEDLVQDTLLQAWRDRERFRGTASPLTWILAIAKNRVRDSGRKSARRQELDRVLDRIDTTDLPDDILASEEFGLRVRQALRELPLEIVGLLIGRYVDGRTVRDLAEESGESESAVESRLRRACESLRDRLKEECRYE